MKKYMDLSEKLAKKQVIEKITLELVYEFLILESKEMDVFKVDDLNLVDDDKYMMLVDEAIMKLNQKTRLNLKRQNEKIYLGNCNK